MRFYIGLHQPAHARLFDRAMVSVNRLRTRKSDFPANEWLLDSGAFTEISHHGGYRSPPDEYAEQIVRWARVGRLAAAVSQDFMCERFILEKTGLTVGRHQELTIERYDAIAQLVNGAAYLMPVLQGFAPAEYVRHVRMYGDRLAPGAWVGVGSVCKRNADPRAVEAVLLAIHEERPDLELHGFGVKLTALGSDIVRALLSSADSLAWSFAARYEGRDQNSPLEAAGYVERVQKQEWQRDLFTPRR